MIGRQDHVGTIAADTVVVWISEDLTASCIDEASRIFPLETGGTFMGWWSDAATAVITAIIGPGPKATHGQRCFQPDQEWQLDQIAQRYETSGRRETYLGDWHNHPNRPDSTPSWTDRRALRLVISTPSARCSTPLMAVFWGNPDGWQTAVWYARLRRRLFLWDQLVVRKAQLHSYN